MIGDGADPSDLLANGDWAPGLDAEERQVALLRTRDRAVKVVLRDGRSVTIQTSRP